jgi:hypothetical protein
MKTNCTETTQSRKGPLPKSQSGRLLVYESLFTLNQNFEQILDGLERLGGLGPFRKRLRREFIKGCQLAVRETRAWANFELTHIMQAVEENEWGRYGRLRRRLENPGDVPAAAELAKDVPLARANKPGSRRKTR